MRAGSRTAVALTVATALTGTSPLSAHRLDECLQAARIAVEPDRVDLELTLTPGVAVADSIVSAIDRNRDALLSSDEKRAYVQSLVASLDLTVDDHALRLEAAESTFADVVALQRGEGVIQLRFGAALPDLSEGPHRVFFRNAYRRDISVYLANALVPGSDRVAVTAQHHDAEQRDLTIDYLLRHERSTSMTVWLFGAFGALVAAFLVRSPRRSDHSVRRLDAFGSPDADRPI